jgi:DNA polymerase-3 subunit beta
MIVQKEGLMKALRVCSAFGGSGVAHAMAFQNVVLETDKDVIWLKFASVDGYYIQKIPAEGATEGSVAIHMKKFAKLIESISADDIVLKIEKDHVKVDIGASSYKFQTSEFYGEFPDLDMSSGWEKVGEVNAVLLVKEIERVKDFASNSTDIDRSIMQGILVDATKDGIRIVATDGHRLAVSRLIGEISQSVVLPRAGWKVLKELLASSLGQAVIFKKENLIYVKTDDDSCHLILKELEGTYPNYQSVLSSFLPKHHVKIENYTLEEILKRMIAVVGNDTPLRLTFKNSMLEISGEDIGNVQAKEIIACDGDVENNVVLGINSKYFLSAVQKIETQKVFVGITDDESAVWIKSTDEDVDTLVCLIMPIRV